jgi:hypothetical protein
MVVLQAAQTALDIPALDAAAEMFVINLDRSPERMQRLPICGPATRPGTKDDTRTPGWAWCLDLCRIGYVLFVAVAAVKAWREKKRWWKERMKERQQPHNVRPTLNRAA